MMFTLRTQKKIARLAKEDPEGLVWVKKHFPDAYWDEHYLYRRIPRNQLNNARKGGWKVVDTNV